MFDHLLLVANVAGSGESSQLRRCKFALNRATEVDESSIFGDEESRVHTQGQVRLSHSSGMQRGDDRKYGVRAEQDRAVLGSATSLAWLFVL